MIGKITVHPSDTTTRMSTSSTISNDTAQMAEMMLYLFVRQDVLCRSARPSQVAISVSNTVMTNVPIHMRAVCIHAP